MQVFASTHSQDCIDALATICDASRADSSDITLHRIDHQRSHAVRYDEGNIIALALDHMEAR